jgi:hypothetical protein
MKYNPLVEYTQTLIEPLPDLYTLWEAGEYAIQVLPRQDLDEDGVNKYWRIFGKFPNEFAAAVYRSLPDDVEFQSYDHLQNKLTLFKL